MITITLEGFSAGRNGAVLAGPIDLTLRAGEALVVTGENGAGKSTLLRTLAGLLPAVAGALAVEGATAPDGEPARTLAEIAHYVGHRNAMKPGLPVRDNLLFWRAFLGGEGLGIEDALAALGLPGIAHLPFGYLSAGQQRRASLARLVVVRRPVWLLDEPTAALDAGSQARFASLMRDHLASGGILVAATHQPLGLESARELRLERKSARPAREYSAAELDAAEGWL